MAAVVVGTLARTAAFNGDGLRLDKDGNVFVGTSKGHTVFKVTPKGEITLFASLASGSANGSYFDSKGNLYVANETAGIVHKITADGNVSDYMTGLDGPAGIYIDEQDNMFISLFGYSSPAAKVLKVTPDMVTSTYASGGGLMNVVGITGDGHGRYFASNFYTGEIFEITDGTVKQLGASETRVNHIKYANGYIYTPNPMDQVVRRMDMNGKFEILAGTKSVAGSDDGEGELAKFSRPNSIDISKDGKTAFILDFNTGDVRTITINK
jgi:sugar lactone lactonase YvrE